MPLHYTAIVLVLAQAAPVATAPIPVVTQQPTHGSSTSLTLLQDTPVELMAIAEVNTDKAQPGDLIRFRVNRAIEIGGRVAVPVGTPAFGQVTTAKDAGGLGKSGRMTAKLLRIQLGEIEIPLEGEMAAKGTGAGSAGVAILLTGIAGFFHRGNNAKIKAGEIVAGFVGSDVVLSPSSGT
ncbi:hypothetical protein [Sphingomonas sp. R86521]|uniref:hypothetical protein n=1 Tax=Sphingomonas sp. R86521 TaxID=3093860 RepID=UPI0036D3786A